MQSMDSAKDYYGVLEVRQTESLEGIHRAYRRLAKQYHPDRAGAEGAMRFRAIQEAYQVLSDPRQRKQYDAASFGQPASQAVPEPLLRRKSPHSHPEPLSSSPIHVTRRGHELFAGAFRNDVREFARLAETFLSPVLLSPQLTQDEEDLLRLYLCQLVDRYGL